MESLEQIQETRLIDSEGDESGTVYAEDRRGYFINGSLLRPARVAILK